MFGAIRGAVSDALLSTAWTKPSWTDCPNLERLHTNSQRRVVSRRKVFSFFWTISHHTVVRHPPGEWAMASGVHGGDLRALTSRRPVNGI